MTVIVVSPHLLESLGVREENYEGRLERQIKESKYLENSYGVLGFKIRRLYLYFVANVNPDISREEFTKRYLGFIESENVKGIYWDYVVDNIYDKEGVLAYNSFVIRKLSRIIGLETD